MKQRNGFVSNSSSSSFVLGIKGKLTTEELMRIFGAPENSLLSDIGEELASFFVSACEPVDEAELNEWKKDDYNKEFIEYCEKHGLKMYYGDASDEGTDGIERYLCDNSFHMATEEFYVDGGGGY